MYNSKFTVGGRVVDLAPFTVMGIINVTPDSFSDGGRFFNFDHALAHARALADEGAAILDIGGESTRPGSLPVEQPEEERRVLPLVQALAQLRGARSLRCISVDTWRSRTAAACLGAGCDIINDISGCLFDNAMPDVLANFKPGYILGHSPARPATMQNNPHYVNVVEEVYSFFAGQLEMLEKKGLPAENVVLDPGLGFGKTLQHNLALLHDLGRGEGKSRLHSLGRPVCIGLSRKTMLRELLGLTQVNEQMNEQMNGQAAKVRQDVVEKTATDFLAQRDVATQVFSALLLERGVFLHRVHAVFGACNALKLALSLKAV